MPETAKNKNINLFTVQKSDAFIIESVTDRKYDNVKQISGALLGIQDMLIDIDHIADIPLSANEDSVGALDKVKVHGQLRSALGVSQRRIWMANLKIEDMFRLDSI